MPAKRKTPGKPRLRIPLPRQVGGRHEDKTRRPWRERKHRKKDREGSEE